MQTSHTSSKIQYIPQDNRTFTPLVKLSYRRETRATISVSWNVVLLLYE